MRESLAASVFDALDAHIAVLDADGVLVEVNEAWRRFAGGNGAADSDGFLGANYVSICESAALDPACPTAGEFLEGLRNVLSGRQEHFRLEYPCASPTEERWFDAYVTRIPASPAMFVVVHHDITAGKQSRLSLQDTELLLRKVLETLPVGIWIQNAAGVIVLGNPAGQKIWAGHRYVGPEEFGEYKGWWLQSGKPIAPEEWAGARAILSGETSIDEEIKIECFDGTRKIILNSAMPLRTADGRITGSIIVNQDVTERFAAQEELRRAKDALERVNVELQEALTREHQLARTDVLTGARNRRDFFEIATHQLGVARRYGGEISLILFDIDHFKRVNDSYGHEEGDEVLRRVARIAQAGIREADLVARYGGEEFIVLLPNSPTELAAVVAERIRSGIERAFRPGEDPIGTLTISAGVAGCVPRDETLDDLIRRADQALYRAKEGGRNRVEISQPRGIEVKIEDLTI